MARVIFLSVTEMLATRMMVVNRLDGLVLRTFDRRR